MSRSIILFAILLSNTILAQKPQQDTSKLLIEKDSIFWVGYNTCNVDLMGQFLAKDVQMYHDQAGNVDSLGFATAIRKNICGDPNNKVRRELVTGTFKLFLLRGGGIIYGAIISYDNHFYISGIERKEIEEEVAKFTSLWLLKEDGWKMHTVFTFDHKPISK